MQAVYDIRIASLADVDSICKLGRDSLRDAYGDMSENDPLEMEVHIQENFQPELIKESLLKPQVIYFLIEINNIAAGYAKLIRNINEEKTEVPQSILLDKIYLLKPFYGQNLGQRLLDHCLSISQKEGFTEMWLVVWELNKRAVRFYEKNGFQITGKTLFKFGSKYSEDLVMKKKL